MVGESQEAVGVGGGSGPSSNKMPTLEEYGTNLTTQAQEVRHISCRFFWNAFWQTMRMNKLCIVPTLGICCESIQLGRARYCIS
jgi:hypothetical protein